MSSFSSDSSGAHSTLAPLVELPRLPEIRPAALLSDPIRESWASALPSDPRSLFDMLRAATELHGTKPAFGFLPAPGAPESERVHMSYAEFDSLVGRCASGLSALGVRRGDRVLLLLPNCVHWAAVAYGANALGAAYVAMYPQVGTARTCACDILQCARVPFVLGSAYHGRRSPAFAARVADAPFQS